MHIEPGWQLHGEKRTIKDDGIDTRFFTSIYIDGKDIWKFCFERGWLELEGGGWVVQDRPEQAEIGV